MEATDEKDIHYFNYCVQYFGDAVGTEPRGTTSNPVQHR